MTGLDSPWGGVLEPWGWVRGGGGGRGLMFVLLNTPCHPHRWFTFFLIRRVEGVWVWLVDGGPGGKHGSFFYPIVESRPTFWTAPSHTVCLRDKPVISLYPVTLICIHICVQKYTSVYSLPLPNSFLTVIRSFHTILFSPTVGSSDFPRSLCCMRFWFGLEIIRLVYKKSVL